MRATVDKLEDKLENIVGRMLAERKLTLATAESCTGGLLVLQRNVAQCRTVLAFGTPCRPPHLAASHMKTARYANLAL
jgi:hypothetical protein